MKNMKILVVDNDIDTQYFWMYLLEDYGANVKTSGSIKDAIAALEMFIPDVLICEIRFLGERVDSLFERVRQIAASRGSTIPIVVTSTSPFDDLPKCLHNLNIEIATYWMKPIGVNTFVDALFGPTALIGQRKQLSPERQA
ncbi:response regulator [filamentous cyanobacterium CCP5]|nr:response regulator [filamentous cyanobacterium CCP5]